MHIQQLQQDEYAFSQQTSPEIAQICLPLLLLLLTGRTPDSGVYYVCNERDKPSTSSSSMSVSVSVSVS